MHQFWNIFNGSAANCDFGDQTQSLVYDIFIVNLSNKQVQEKLCNEPKENPLDALQFAVAYEDGLKRQRTLGNPGKLVSVREEPVFAVTQKANNRSIGDVEQVNSQRRISITAKELAQYVAFVESKDTLKDAAFLNEKSVLEKMPIPANLTKGTKLANACRKSINTKKTEVQKKT